MKYITHDFRIFQALPARTEGADIHYKPMPSEEVPTDIVKHTGSQLLESGDEFYVDFQPGSGRVFYFRILDPGGTSRKASPETVVVQDKGGPW